MKKRKLLKKKSNSALTLLSTEGLTVTSDFNDFVVLSDRCLYLVVDNAKLFDTRLSDGRFLISTQAKDIERQFARLDSFYFQLVMKKIRESLSQFPCDPNKTDWICNFGADLLAVDNLSNCIHHYAAQWTQHLSTMEIKRCCLNTGYCAEIAFSVQWNPQKANQLREWHKFYVDADGSLAIAP